MKTKKQIYRLALLLLSACACFGIQAQETTPQSPWTVGLEFGIPLSIECASCDNHNTSAGVVGLNTHYRLKRWLGMTLNASYYQLEYTYNQWYSVFQVSSTQSVIDTRALALSIGPHLMLRVGQGDLSLEARYGLIINRSKMKGYNSVSGNLKINNSYVDIGINALRLAYTYWPKERFGIQLGIEASDNQFPVTFPLLIDGEPVEEYTLNLISSRGFTQISLMLGTHYRF